MDEVFSYPLAVLKQNSRMVIPKEVVLVFFGNFGRGSVIIRIPRDTRFQFFACVKFEHVLVALAFLLKNLNPVSFFFELVEENWQEFC
jgi:hypothetical protein